jgi:hypothetical protein
VPLVVFPTLVVPIARTGDLIALKLLSREDRRPQDAIDLQSLLGVGDSSELARARESVRLIAARRCTRGRDLETDLDALLASRA